MVDVWLMCIVACCCMYCVLMRCVCVVMRVLCVLMCVAAYAYCVMFDSFLAFAMLDALNAYFPSPPSFS